MDKLKNSLPIKSQQTDKISEDLFELIDLIDGVVPARFYEVLKIAKLIERLTGGASFLSSDGVNSEILKVPSKNDNTLKKNSDDGYELKQTRHTATRLSDLNHLTAKEWAEAGSTVNVLQSYIRNELKITSLVIDNEIEYENVTITSDNGNINEDEQELYILLDLSYSMRNKSRLLLAQTLVLWYLSLKFVKQKKRPRIYLRGFADKVSDLVKVEHINDLKGLIDEILSADAANVGTELQAAILQASKDISFFNPYGNKNGAEILLITDGLAALDWEYVNTVLNDFNIKLNVVLIGSTKVLPSNADIDKLVGNLFFEFDEKNGISIKEQKIKYATAHYNRIHKEPWEELAENLLEIEDIEFNENDISMIKEFSDFLNKYVFCISFFSASENLKKRVVYIYDIVTQMLNDIDSENTSEIKDLKHKIESWLSDGFEFTIESLNNRTKAKKKENATLKLGMNKITMAFMLTSKLSEGPKVFIDIFEILMRYIALLFLKLFGKDKD